MNANLPVYFCSSTDTGTLVYHGLFWQVMCALAGGRLLLNLKYVSKSWEAGRWLNPEDPRFMLRQDLSQLARQEHRLLTLGM